MMNKRYIIAAVLMLLGFLTIAGAVGGNERGTIGLQETLIRGTVGAALIAASVPISGDLKRGDNDDKG